MIIIKQEFELLEMIRCYKDNLVEVQHSHSHSHITNPRVLDFLSHHPINCIPVFSLGMMPSLGLCNNRGPGRVALKQCVRTYEGSTYHTPEIFKCIYEAE